MNRKTLLPIQASEELEGQALLVSARGSADCYEREWVITIKADTLRGAMDAVWQCWEAWKQGHEPCGGNMPRSMGDPMTYNVKRVKEPSPPNAKLTP